MTRVLERLLDGDPPAGGMLPHEEAMADEYRISRGVVRETMRALEERSVLAVKHGRGARVLPTSDWNVLDPDVIAAMLDARDGDALLREITEYRAMLAPRAARLAAERRSDEDVEALRGAMQRMAEAAPARPGRGRADERVAAEADFHRILAAATGNRPLARTLSALIDGLEQRGGLATRREDGLDEHRRILAAVRNRDAQAAARSMRAHLEGATRQGEEAAGDRPAAG